MEDCERAGASGGVVDDRVEESLVHLGLVEAAEEEEDGLAGQLEPALVAEEIGQDIHDPAVGQELAQAQMVRDPLQENGRKNQRYFQFLCLRRESSLTRVL